MAQDVCHTSDSDPLEIRFTIPCSATAQEAAELRRQIQFRFGLTLAICGCVVIGAFAFIAIVPRYSILGYIVLIISGSLFAGYAWGWKNTVFCPDCGMIVSDTFSGQLFRWCSECGRLMKPEELRSENGRLEIDIRTASSEADPVFKCLKLLLNLSIHDRADELAFVPSEQGYQVYTRIDGAVYEIVPPPPELHRLIVAAAKAVWNHDPYAADIAPSEIELRSERGSTLTVAEFTSTDSGEMLSLHFNHVTREACTVTV